MLRAEQRMDDRSSLNTAAYSNGGCTSAPASCRCFEEQELCAWESPDCGNERVLAQQLPPT